jgi:hypothetical protein
MKISATREKEVERHARERARGTTLESRQGPGPADGPVVASSTADRVSTRLQRRQNAPLPPRVAVAALALGQAARDEAARDEAALGQAARDEAALNAVTSSRHGLQPVPARLDDKTCAGPAAPTHELVPATRSAAQPAGEATRT